MKELSIEEKAKRYDEAIDKVAYFIKKHIGFGCMIHPNSSEAKELFNIFPELKESEDERIRKEIIATIHLYYGEPLEDEAKEMIAWLEKQGEQKPAFEMITPEESLGIDSDTYNKIVDECIYGEQKSTDKVEPKFKIGDWIVLSTSYGEKVVQIDSIEYFKSGEPRYITSEGRWFGNAAKARLWNIQDAKDGNVLYSPCCKLLCIYKDEKTCHVGSYLNYNYGSIVVNEPIYIPTDAHPATKEQREQLEKAMADAGYTFDFEKKELKKIKQSPIDVRTKGHWHVEDVEQKPAWGEEDEEILFTKREAGKH